MNTLLRTDRRSFRATVLALAISVAGATPTLALAADPAAPPAGAVRERVVVTDLDLGSVAGREEAARRLRAVVRRACAEAVNGRRVDAVAATADCERDALADGLSALRTAAAVAGARSDPPEAVASR